MYRRLSTCRECCFNSIEASSLLRCFQVLQACTLWGPYFNIRTIPSVVHGNQFLVQYLVDVLRYCATNRQTTSHSNNVDQSACLGCTAAPRCNDHRPNSAVLCKIVQIDKIPGTASAEGRRSINTGPDSLQPEWGLFWCFGMSLGVVSVFKRAHLWKRQFIKPGIAGHKHCLPGVYP